MTRRTWTLPEIREVRRRYAEGETWVQIGRDYGVSKSSARSAALTFGPTPLRGGRTCVHEDKILAALALRNTECPSWAVIADRVGYPHKAGSLYSACYSYAKKHGLKLEKGAPIVDRRRQPETVVRPKKNRSWSMPDLVEAQRLFDEGMTWAQVGAHFGTKGETIRQIVGYHFKKTRKHRSPNAKL